MPGNRGKAVYKTLDKGQYAISAKNVMMENTRTGETITLGETDPVYAKDLIEYQMLMPKDRLMKTLPGIVGEFFASRGTWDDKKEWNVKFTKV
jgi:hypothetical protein